MGSYTTSKIADLKKAEQNVLLRYRLLEESQKEEFRQGLKKMADNGSAADAALQNTI